MAKFVDPVTDGVTPIPAGDWTKLHRLLNSGAGVTDVQLQPERRRGDVGDPPRDRVQHLVGLTDRQPDSHAGDS